MSTKLQGKSIAQIRDLARQDAADLLARHWFTGLVPIDPVFLARQLGISVFSAQLGDDTWGMLIGSSGGADIYLDQDQPPTRYRFSCAHEIGHFIERGADLLTDGAFVDKRSDSDRGRADEVYANEFAGSILMPRPEFERAILSGDGDYDLAARFDVSYDAVRVRRARLNI